MKKVIAVFLLCVLIVLQVGCAHTATRSSEGNRNKSDDLIIVEYYVETGAVSSQTLGEIRDTLDPSIAASYPDETDAEHLDEMMPSFAEMVYTKVEEAEPHPFLSIKTEKDRYSVNDTEIPYSITVPSEIDPEAAFVSATPEGELLIHDPGNSDNRLEVFWEDGWYNVPYRTDKVFIDTLDNCYFPLGKTIERKFILSTYFKLPLPAGEYRINHGGGVYSNTFIIE